MAINSRLSYNIILQPTAGANIHANITVGPDPLHSANKGRIYTICTIKDNKEDVVFGRMRTQLTETRDSNRKIVQRSVQILKLENYTATQFSPNYITDTLLKCAYVHSVTCGRGGHIVNLENQTISHSFFNASPSPEEFQCEFETESQIEALRELQSPDLNRIALQYEQARVAMLNESITEMEKAVTNRVQKMQQEVMEELKLMGGLAASMQSKAEKLHEQAIKGQKEVEKLKTENAALQNELRELKSTSTSRVTVNAEPKQKPVILPPIQQQVEPKPVDSTEEVLRKANLLLARLQVKKD